MLPFSSRQEPQKPNPEPNPENIYKIPDAANRYELLRQIPRGVLERYSNKIVANIPDGGTVVEAGFGPGHLLLDIARAGQSKNIKVIGIDNSAEMHRLVQEKLKEETSPDNILLLQESLDEYFVSHPGSVDGIHFKAILHCFRDPIRALDAMDIALRSGGVIITGHEASQTESRIERLYETSPNIDDPELEYLLGYYFELRSRMAYSSGLPEKAFSLRRFPAGDSSQACEYFISKGYQQVDTSIKDELNFERSYTMQELLDSIKNGTFGVFRDGLNSNDINNLAEMVKKFAEKENIDMNKVRKIPARWQQNTLRKP